MVFLDLALLKIVTLPKVSVNLMLEKTEGNDPFFAGVVKKFHTLATSRHPKFPLVRQYEFGFALCRMPATFEEYYQSLKKSARWNFRKATRLGYEVKRFDVNSKLDDMAAIWRSAPVRQGRLPKWIREGRVSAVNDPPSRSPFHDYFYIGVFAKDRLLAYASVAIMGELCNLNDLYGHVEYENDALVPLLLIKIAESLYSTYPSVKFYAYGTYFGARAPMRRFKRKFQFYPYHVDWVLQTPPQSQKEKYIYRMGMFHESACERLADGAFIKVMRLEDVPMMFGLWRKNFSWIKAIVFTLKIMTGKRVFFGIIAGNKIVQMGWASLGFCRYYSIEPDSVVLGRLWTDPLYRNKGLATGSMRRIMNILFRRGYRRFYIDTHPSNIAMQKAISKAGFSQRVD